MNEIDNRLVDEGSERAVLACIMQEPATMVEASVKLKADDFVNENNRYLYDIMSSVFKDKGGRECRYDIASLMAIAKRRGAEDRFVQRMGGEQYIAYLTLVKDSHIDLESFNDYVGTVSSLSVKRKLFETNERFKEEILDSESSPEELIVKEQNDINDILMESSNDGNVFTNLADGAEEFLKNARENKRKTLGVPTGYPALDDTIEGLKRGNLLIMAAPRKTGKSAFLMNIAVNVGVLRKVPTLMISTEMSDEEILSRSLACLSNVPEKKIQKGYMDQVESKLVDNAKRELSEGKFYHLVMRGFTLEKIIGTVRKFVNNEVGYKPDGKPKDCVIVFDYIKMPTVGLSTSQEQKEYKVLGQIADGLKILSGDLDVPILTACQTNRAGDVANSYELTWFCNTFMVLTKKSDNQMNKDENDMGGYHGNQLLKITANRGGEENHDGIAFDYNGPTLKYNELPMRLRNAPVREYAGSGQAPQAPQFG